MASVRTALLALDIVLTAAIAGFFYAYASTVMRGLDAAPPETAIVAMNAINAHVRNAVFAPAFFGPLVVGLALTASYGLASHPSAWLARAAVLTYLLGGLVPTFAVNVPMNEALGSAAVPADPAAARELWAGYSRTWTAWNTTRTVFSFVSLVLLLASFAGEVRRIGQGPT